MELFLLLSALIASLTGTARQVAPGMPSLVQAQRAVADHTLGISGGARRALAMVRTAAPIPRPDGYVAPDVFAPHDIEPGMIAALGIACRRE